MRSEITEIRRAISTICAKQGPSRSAGDCGSRTDAGVSRALTGATVDAAMADEGIDFVKPSTDGPKLRKDNTQVVAGLSAQLAQLEGQCSHLRQMLQLASQDAH